MKKLILLLLFVAAVALAAAPAPLLSRSCLVQPYVSGPPSAMWQYQLRVDYPPGCRANLLYIRIRTRNGGLILPPIGYFRLSPAFPREIRYWVFPGARIEQRTDKGWVARPIQHLPEGWY